jgi:hypothetical protein
VGERSLCNFEVLEDEKGREKRVAIPAADIGDKLLTLIHPNVLRRVAGELYAIDPTARQFDRITGADNLFGWIQCQFINVFWSNTTPGCITKSEFLSFLRRKVEARIAIRTLPHQPPLAGVEYLCDDDMGEENHGALDELVDFWKPSTKHDRSLILAAFCTPFWGGAGGARPAISIESDGTDHGRGIGKSQLMYAIANVAGGHIDCSLKEDIANVKKRLLTEGTKASVVAFDNCKASRISSAELEGLITAPTVSGWKPHLGNAEISNLLTYVFTMNDAAFSTDMSTRSARIMLARQIADSRWQGKLDAFLQRARAEIVNDCIYYLRAEPREQLTYIRFSKWQHDVLSRIDGSDEVARILKARQIEVDADAEASGDYSGAIQYRLGEYFKPGLNPFEKTRCDPDKDSFIIARDVLCDWIRSRFDRQMTNTAITQALRRARIPNLLDEHVVRRGVRFWTWRASPVFEPKSAWRIQSRDTSQVLEPHTFKEKNCTQDAGADVINFTTSAPAKISNDDGR